MILDAIPVTIFATLAAGFCPGCQVTGSEATSLETRHTAMRFRLCAGPSPYFSAKGAVSPGGRIHSSRRDKPTPVWAAGTTTPQEAFLRVVFKIHECKKGLIVRFHA